MILVFSINSGKHTTIWIYNNSNVATIIVWI